MSISPKSWFNPKRIVPVLGMVLFLFFVFQSFDSRKTPIASSLPTPASSFAKPAPETWEADVWNLISSKEFQTIQGSTWSLQKHPEAKLIAVNFWGTYCPPCIAEIPLFDSLVKTKQGSFVVLGLSAEDIRDVSKFARRKNISFPLLILSEQEMERKAFEQVTAIPVTLFFDAQGHQIGIIDGISEISALQSIFKAAHI